MPISVSLGRQLVSRWARNPSLVPLPKTVALAAVLSINHALLVGCSGSDNNTPSTFSLGDYSVKIAGCEQYDYAGCDISQAECQQGTFDLVKCVRQTSAGAMPPMQTMTTAQFQAKLVSDNGNVSADDTARLETTLVLLGLASAGDLSVQNQASVLASNILAFYSADDKNVTIIVPDSGMTASTQRENTLTLAHEFVHALQDQAYDLNAFKDAHKATDDAYLAADSVVEGEARFYETKLRVAFDGLAQDAVHLPEYFQTNADYAFSQHATDSSYLTTSLIFPYDYGGRYIYWQLEAGGRSNIDGLFTSPPPATLPYNLSQTGIIDTVLSPVADPTPTPDAGFSLFEDDSLGAWLTYETVRTAGGNSTNADAINYAGDWRGDHLWIYSDGTANNVAFIWKVRWATASAATSFISRFSSLHTSVQTIASGSDALIVGTSGTPTPATWLAIAKAMSNQTAPASPGNAPGSAGATSDTNAGVRRVLISPIVRMP